MSFLSWNSLTITGAASIGGSRSSRSLAGWSDTTASAIKLQCRDVDSFIHKAFRDRQDIRYIKKTVDTRLSRESFEALVHEIRRSGCIPMATPFDEASVALCVDLGLDIIKLASSDLNDWILIEEIAKTRKPVIASTGGSSGS